MRTNEETREATVDDKKPNSILRCPSCGAVGYPDDRYCAGCGSAMCPTCHHCGAAVRQPFADFCSQCGKALENI